jgi:hypothetical protein
MLIGFALFAIALLTATRTDAVIPSFVASGLVGGLSAGPFMSLPVRILTPPVRGMVSCRKPEQAAPPGGRRPHATGRRRVDRAGVTSAVTLGGGFLLVS